MNILHDNSTECGFYCITFIEYMIAGKTLLYYIKSFVSVNNVLREYNKTKEDIKYPQNAVRYAI